LHTEKSFSSFSGEDEVFDSILHLVKREVEDDSFTFKRGKLIVKTNLQNFLEKLLS